MKYQTVIIVVLLIIATTLVPASLAQNDEHPVNPPAAGTAAHDLTASRVVDSGHCEIKTGETVLAVARSSSGIIAYASGVGCEGLVVFDDDITWENRADLDKLPYVQMKVVLPRIITRLDDYADKCENAQPGGYYPPGGPPYSFFYPGGFDYSSTNEFRATDQSGVEVIICTQDRSVTLQNCAYVDSAGRQAATIRRVREDLVIQIVNYETGRIITNYTLPGNTPSGCPATTTHSDTITGQQLHVSAGVGWILKQIGGEAAASTARTVVQVDTLNARSEPNTSSDILAKIPRNTPVNLIARNESGDWVVALLPDMTQAWLFSDLLTISAYTPVDTLPVTAEVAGKVALLLPASLTPTDESLETAAAVNAVAHNADWKPVIQEFEGVEMVLVPPGCFMMGSTDQQVNTFIQLCEEEFGADQCRRDLFDWERPVYRTCVDEPFWIDRYEVSNAQFAAFDGMAEQDYEIPAEYQNEPRGLVSWFEARDYCMASRAIRLPTEAEWEYAARGPDSLLYPWGSEFVANKVARHGDRAAVGSKPQGASWVGALDLSGGYLEWTNTIFKPSVYSGPYKADDGREDLMDMSSNRAVRSGALYAGDAAYQYHAAFRESYFPQEGSPIIGIRCARDYLPGDLTAESQAALPGSENEAAAAASSSEIFTADFTSNSQRWDLNRDVSLQDGALQITATEEGSLYAASVPDQERGDFSLTVDVVPDTSGKYQYGVWFRGKDGFANGYFFVVEPDSGYYSLQLGLDDEWQAEVVSWRFSPQFRIGQANRLGVVASGAKISLYINGVRVSTVTDDRLAAGEIMLVVGTYTGEVAPAAADFDNLVIAAGFGSSHPPALASAASVTAGFADDFSANQNHWTLDREVSLQAGTLQITSPQADSLGYSVIPDMERDNFDLTVDIAPKTSGQYQYGVWFRGTADLYNGYFFTIDPVSSSYALFLRLGSEWHDVVAWESTPFIKSDSVNRLGIVASESFITLYINGTSVKTVEDIRRRTGSICLVVGTYADGVFPVTAQFDNLVIEAR